MVHHPYITLTDSVLRYMHFTQPGSSGSLIFNSAYDLVGIHVGKDYNGGYNYGCRVAAIFEECIQQVTPQKVAQAKAEDTVNDLAVGETRTVIVPGKHLACAGHAGCVDAVYAHLD